jgi:hypothetical protein
LLGLIETVRFDASPVLLRISVVRPSRAFRLVVGRVLAVGDGELLVGVGDELVGVGDELVGVGDDDVGAGEDVVGVGAGVAPVVGAAPTLPTAVPVSPYCPFTAVCSAHDPRITTATHPARMRPYSTAEAPASCRPGFRAARRDTRRDIASPPGTFEGAVADRVPSRVSADDPGMPSDTGSTVSVEGMIRSRPGE